MWPHHGPGTAPPWQRCTTSTCSLLLALFSYHVRRLPVSGPLLALLIGVLAGPYVLDVVSVPEDVQELLLPEAARLMLAVSLIGVALRFPVSALRLFPVAVLLLRRPPVVVALGRLLGLRLRDAVFAGWFGPIGVSAVFYLVLSAEQGATDPRLFAAGTLAVAASTLVHGVTAVPGRKAYARG